MIYLTIVFTIVAAVCGWAVFSKQVKDDAIEKHCLSFASILSGLVVVGIVFDHVILMNAVIGCSVLIVFAGLYFSLKNFWHLYRITYGRTHTE